MLAQSLGCAEAPVTRDSDATRAAAQRCMSFMAFPSSVEARWRLRRFSLLPEADRHEAQHFEEHLRADLRGVGRRIVLRRDFDHVAADDVESGESAQY